MKPKETNIPPSVVLFFTRGELSTENLSYEEIVFIFRNIPPEHPLFQFGIASCVTFSEAKDLYLQAKNLSKWSENMRCIQERVLSHMLLVAQTFDEWLFLCTDHFSYEKAFAEIYRLASTLSEWCNVFDLASEHKYARIALKKVYTLAITFEDWKIVFSSYPLSDKAQRLRSKSFSKMFSLAIQYEDFEYLSSKAGHNWTQQLKIFEKCLEIVHNASGLLPFYERLCKEKNLAKKLKGLAKKFFDI